MAGSENEGIVITGSFSASLYPNVYRVPYPVWSGGGQNLPLAKETENSNILLFQLLYANTR